MTRSVEDKEAFRKAAKLLVANASHMQLAAEETTGADDFKHKEAPEVCAVVIDKSSDVGLVQISGGGKTDIVRTGTEEQGHVLKKILDNQSCMLYGRPTVLFVYPAG